MTVRVYEVSGKLVEVATMEDVDGEAGDVPVATATTVGTVKGGGNVAIASDGTMTASAATAAVNGSVKRAAAVASATATSAPAWTASTATDVAGLLADLNTLGADYNTLRTSYLALTTTVNTIIANLKAAGSLS